MPIIFRCEHCQQRMSISRKLGGKTTTCPRCGQSTYVPPEEEVSEVSEPVSPSSEPDNSLQDETPEENIPEVSAAPSYSPAVEPRLAPPETEDTPAEEIEFQLGKRSSDDEEMDLTPMVDVTFLLLIFFMVTASFSIQKSIEVPVPDPDQEGVSQTVQPLEELEEQSILIEIDAQNRFMVETEPLNDPRDLPTRLATLRSEQSKTDVMISVDERSHHEAIVTAIDAAQEAGMQRIRWGVAPEN